MLCYISLDVTYYYNIMLYILTAEHVSYLIKASDLDSQRKLKNMIFKNAL